MKIRTRAIVIIVCTNFAIILLSIFAGTGYARKNIEKYIEADMLVVADIADRFISSELNLLRLEGGKLTEALVLSASDEWGEILGLQLQQNPQFIGGSVVSKERGVIASAGTHSAPFEIAANEQVRQAFFGEISITSTVPTASGVVFYLALPMDGVENTILVLTLDGNFFSVLVSEYQLWQTGHIFIDDSAGYIIANIRSEWVQDRQNFLIAAQDNDQYDPIADSIRKVISGERGIAYYSIGGIPRICAYRSISGSHEGWCLGIVAPLSESPVRNVDRGLMIIAGVGFLLNVAAAIVASEFIKKPFEEVALLKGAAESDSQAKSNFLAQMSHEIRTPLNAVVGLSELTLGEETLSEEASSNLKKIYGAGSIILNIVNDVLDISKIESGKFELHPVRYDTPSMINDTATLNAVRIGSKPIEFSIRVDETMPDALLGDDLRVKQVFNNLLSNAIKFTSKGTVEWNISFEETDGEGWLISSVCDTGIGIQEGQMDKLFTDFQQVDMQANRTVGGTGLGLAITKRLVEMMGGKIEVQSQYGKGTVFRVCLRQKAASDTKIGKEIAENLTKMDYTLAKQDTRKKRAHQDLSYAHVLLVDDVPTNLDVMRGMLKPYAVQTDCAESGQQAVDMIKKGKPRYSAVFMDHMMPGIDGIEATRMIREEIGTSYAKNVPILALTANALVGNEKMFLSHGFQAFLSKPLDAEKLEAVLYQYVRSRGRERQSMPETESEGQGRRKMTGDWVSEISGLDLEKARNRFGGNETVLAEVLETYAESTSVLLEKLRQSLREKDLQSYAITVHGIKGSSRGIFAESVGREAEALEGAAKSGSLEWVNSRHEGFAQEVEVLIREIKRVLAERGVKKSKPIEKFPDAKLLAELRKACAAFDMDGVDAAMKRLESYQYKSKGSLVKWLREQVNNMNFEAISDGDWLEPRE